MASDVFKYSLKRLVIPCSLSGPVHSHGTRKAPLHGDRSSSSSSLCLSSQHALLRIDRLVVRPPRALPPPPNVTRAPSVTSGRSIASTSLQPARATMPPLAPTHGEKSSSSSGGRHQRQGMAAAPAQQRRSASFHGRGTEQLQRHLQKQRPKTLPDLLAGVRGASSLRSGSRSPPSPDGDGDDTGRRTRTPSKVLVSVAVQQSMWPLHVMASAEWTVADLVAAAVALYVKEGRRPPLPSTDPAAFGLHYSQFSLESLNPKEQIMELGSRSFFLCPRSPSIADQDASSSSSAANGVDCAASGKTPAWLSYMPFWPTM